ncbi:MAG: hypothetical protein F6K65_43375 [Moorea sp. SIO3C2]|nr:hypothetical protein [Moorena sp. SIO3C2]
MAVVEHLRNGQMLAFDVLFQRYGVKIYSVAYAIVADVKEAETITQEVFTALWQVNQPISEWLENQESLHAGLMTLTRSHSLALIKRRDWVCKLLKFWRSLFPGQRPAELFVISQDNHAEHEARATDQLLATLSKKEREILKLVYAEAITPERLAKRLRLPDSVATYRARKVLTKLHQRRVYV